MYLVLHIAKNSHDPIHFQIPFIAAAQHFVAGFTSGKE
jgi:hypothetical protein